MVGKQLPNPMAEAVIIERCLWEGQQRHVARQLRVLTDRINRLEAQVRLLSVGVGRQRRAAIETAGRTRPHLVS